MVQSVGCTVQGAGCRVRDGEGLACLSSGETWTRETGGVAFPLEQNRVHGFGPRVSGSGFQVPGFGLRRSGSRFRGWCFVFWVPGFISQFSGFGFQFRFSGFGFPGSAFRVSCFGFRISRFRGSCLVLRVSLPPEPCTLHPAPCTLHPASYIKPGFRVYPLRLFPLRQSRALPVPDKSSG